jgi:FtsZ-binding cell division protein ZapB
MKKALKQKILATVSTLRTPIVKLKDSGDKKTNEINNLTKQVDKLETELNQCKDKQAKMHQTPSIAGTTALEEPAVKEHSVPSTATRPEPTEVALLHVALPTEKTSRSYVAAVQETKATAFKMTVRSRGEQSPDSIKQLLKTNINPGEIKVGVKTFKSCNGGVIIETNSKEEIEALGKEIRAKCGTKLEVRVHTRRKPRLIIINVPEDISTNNIEDTILRQNPDLSLQKENIVAKFIYVTKTKCRNAVIEVGADIRKTLLHKKIKLGRQICKTDEYLVATRCYKCSKFNHRTQECRGEVTCPLCAGPHTLKECTGDSTTHKCTNCANYNKYNPTKTINDAHSSLDKKCPSWQAAIEKIRMNTEY